MEEFQSMDNLAPQIELALNAKIDHFYYKIKQMGEQQDLKIRKLDEHYIELLSESQKS